MNFGNMFSTIGQGAGKSSSGFMKGLDLFGNVTKGIQGNGAQGDAFMQQYRPDLLKRKQDADKLGNTAESIVGSFGPWGAAIAGVSKLSDKAFGMKGNGYRNKFSEVMDNTLSMKKQMRNLSDNTKSLFSGDLKGDEVLNQFTFGLLGKSKAEKDAQEAYQYQKWLGGVQSANEMSNASNMARMPAATAPMYGRRGMKVKKSKYC